MPRGNARGRESRLSGGVSRARSLLEGERTWKRGRGRPPARDSEAQRFVFCILQEAAVHQVGLVPPLTYGEIRKRGIAKHVEELRRKGINSELTEAEKRRLDRLVSAGLAQGENAGWVVSVDGGYVLDYGARVFHGVREALSALEADLSIWPAVFPSPRGYGPAQEALRRRVRELGPLKTYARYREDLLRKITELQLWTDMVHVTALAHARHVRDDQFEGLVEKVRTNMEAVRRHGFKDLQHDLRDDLFGPVEKAAKSFARRSSGELDQSASRHSEA